MEQSTSAQMYQQTLQEFGHKVLPAWHPQVKMVQRVLDRLIPQAGLRDQEWEVHVIDDKSQLNAFVLPGYATFSGTDVVWWSPARR
jgi:predicted Zn-dependent protease